MLHLPAHYQAGHEANAPLLFPEYKTTRLRSPKNDLILVPQRLGEITGPVFGDADVTKGENDMTRANGGEAQGQRIIVHGRVLDSAGKPIPDTLIEVWQANAGGRYRHKNDRYLAPLDPNFGGVGRALTDSEGRYIFRTIKPGPYPWRNGPNDWRPAHIHFSISGPSISTRLITQLYFEGDPLIPMCPIVKSIANPDAVQTLIAKLDMSNANPMDCLAYRFDIVLRGQRKTHFENR